MHFCTRLKSFVCVLAVCFVLAVDVAFAADSVTNDPPQDPPFYGGYYIAGRSTTLGDVTIYIPVGDGWAYDSDGYLFRSYNSSVTGKLYTSSGTEYDFNCQGYSTPRYRMSGNNYTYTDLYLTPTSSNIIIADDFAPVYSKEYTLQLLSVAMLGLIAVFSLLHKG